MKKENENMKKDIDLLMGEYNKKIEKEKEAEEGVFRKNCAKLY